MKIEWRKYLFETIVIFIGITMSFVFDGWRKNNEANDKVKAQLTAIENDLIRSIQWTEKIDSNYIESLEYISDFRNNIQFEEADFVDLIWKISEDPIDYQLRELSPHLNQISNPSELNILHERDRIVTLVAYIQNLILTDKELSESITNHVNQTIWPKLAKDGLLTKIIKGDPAERFGTDTTIVWSDKMYTISMFDKMDSDLAFVELKITRIIQVHVALRRQIGRLREELAKIQ